jgi:hypothetical protein
MGISKQLNDESVLQALGKLKLSRIIRKILGEKIEHEDKIGAFQRDTRT